MRKNWMALGLLVWMIGCLGACRPAGSDRQAIYIGAVGALPEYDQTMFQGMRLYLDQINKQGGIQGRPVELIELYDQGDPDIARQQAQELVKRQVICVIGHSWSTPSLAAGPIYRQQGIPAITASATAPDVTRNNEWYFRTVFNNDSQGRFVAYYLKQILGQDRVSIIWNQDDYGTSLQQAFKQTAAQVGIEVPYEWHFDDQGADMVQVFDQIVADLNTRSDAGALFLAVQYNDGIELVRRIRDLGLTNLIVSDDAVGSQSFPQEFAGLPHEQQRPGFYSDNVYAPTMLIWDIANQHAQDIYLSFRSAYGQEPDYMAAVYYDAVALAVEAIRRSGAAGLPLPQARQAVRDQLAAFQSLDRAFAASTGPLYFDANRDAVMTVPMGIFVGQRFISAPMQFQPVLNSERIPDLEQAVQEGLVVQIDGQYMYKTKVVYTGLDINEISDLSTGKFSYLLDMYVWFRYHEQPGVDVTDVEWVNAATPFKLEKPVAESHTADGMAYRAFRVKSTFLGNFSFHNYPFDQQVLSARFRHRTLTSEYLIYAIDLLGMPRLADGSWSDYLRSNALSSSEGWYVTKSLIFQDTLVHDSTLGNPRLFDADTAMSYSQVNAQIYIKRDTLSYSIKNLFPILILIIVSFIVLFISAQALMPRIATEVTVILTVALFSNRLSGDLPQVGYLSALEYVFFLVYVLALYVMAISILDYRYEKTTWMKRLNLISRIAYPLVILIAAVAMIYVYLL